MAEVEFQIICAIIALLIFLLLTVSWFLSYCGLFTTIDINAGKPPFSNLYVAYKFRTGPYKNSGEIFTELSKLTPKLRCFGIYYDDPQEVPPQDLRYIVGAILAEGDEEPHEIERDQLRSEGYTLTTFPSIAHAVVTSFPFKNMISIFIAILRVYPRLAEYVKTRKLSARPCIEVYDKDIIHFVMPLSRQSDFFVKETLDLEVDEETGDSIDEGNDIPDNNKSDISPSELLKDFIPKKSTSGQDTNGGSNESASSYEILGESTGQE